MLKQLSFNTYPPNIYELQSLARQNNAILKEIKDILQAILRFTESADEKLDSIESETVAVSELLVELQ